MFKNTSQIQSTLTGYLDSLHKIQRLLKEQRLFSLKRGLYETDPDCPGEVLAGVIYGPSYLSFEYALAAYGLIPERVYTYTSATLRKNRTRQYQNHFGTYLYRDVADTAFPHGLILKQYRERYYTMASPEKALCDLLSIRPAVSNYRMFCDMLFDDLRLDEEGLYALDAGLLAQLAGLYRKSNLRHLSKFVREKMEG